MAVVRNDGTLDFEELKAKIDSDYQIMKDKVSSGRKLPQIQLGETPQVESTPVAAARVTIYDGAAVQVSDKIADQQIKLADEKGEMKAIINEVTEDLKEKAVSGISDKLVLVGAGLILLLLITR